MAQQIINNGTAGDVGALDTLQSGADKINANFNEIYALPLGRDGADGADAPLAETVFALTGTTPVIDPANGTIQTWTLSGNSTPTASLVSGEGLTLMIDDGTDHTITWPAMTWINNGGLAPTLSASVQTVIVLWQVGASLYGSLAGDGT